MKEITDENATRSGSNRTTSLECSKISKQVAAVHTKWSTVCQQVKQLYSKLSIALATISGRSPSPISSTGSLEGTNSDRSLSPEEASKQNGKKSYSHLDSVVINSPPPPSSNSHPASRSASLPRPPNNASLDDLLDSLKEEAEKHNSGSKSQTLPGNRSLLQRGTPPPKNLQLTSSSESQHTPSPPPPKPARTKGVGFQLRGSGSLERVPSCRLSVKLKEMNEQIDGAESTIMKGVASRLESKEIEARLNEIRVKISKSYTYY